MYYIMDLKYYGITTEARKKYVSKFVKDSTRDNGRVVMAPMTNEQRYKYIASGASGKLTQKQQLRYANTLFRPPYNGVSAVFPTSSAPTAPANNINVDYLELFSGVINSFLSKRGTADIILSVDAVNRVYIQEQVDAWIKRNNFKNNNEAIDALKLVKVDNRGFYMFFSASEDIGAILGTIPTIRKITPDSIPANSVLNRSISITSPVSIVQPQFTPVQPQKAVSVNSIAIDTMGKQTNNTNTGIAGTLIKEGTKEVKKDITTASNAAVEIDREAIRKATTDRVKKADIEKLYSTTNVPSLDEYNKIVIAITDKYFADIFSNRDSNYADTYIKGKITRYTNNILNRDNSKPVITTRTWDKKHIVINKAFYDKYLRKDTAKDILELISNIFLYK